MSDQARRVAVIGAGISGLSTLRSLLASDRKYIPTCFERGSDVGGVWLYNENTHTDENGMPVFSSMYRDLMFVQTVVFKNTYDSTSFINEMLPNKSNIPRPMMEFPEFPNTDPETDSSFMPRQEVMNYIKRFTEHFGLRKHIMTHIFVTNVSPNSDERYPEWTVSYYDIRNKKEQKQAVFDAVFVCNGHQHTPNIPDIAGVEEFQGEIIHSKNYRIPEKFIDQRVVILGASYSGTDIAIDISPYAKQIFLSHNKDRVKSVFPDNVTETFGIKRMTRTTVVFLDDTEEEVDVLLFCTGYRYTFPFLSDDVVNVTNNRITPLYKHVVNIKYQNLFFIGILDQVPFFVIGDLLSKFAVAILDGKVKLPSELQMYEDAESDYKDRNDKGDKAHASYDNESIWKFDRELSKLIGIRPSPKAFQLVRGFVKHNIMYNITTFRRRKIQISDDQESFKVLN